MFCMYIHLFNCNKRIHIYIDAACACFDVLVPFISTHPSIHPFSETLINDSSVVLLPFLSVILFLSSHISMVTYRESWRVEQRRATQVCLCYDATAPPAGGQLSNVFLDVTPPTGLAVCHCAVAAPHPPLHMRSNL